MFKIKELSPFWKWTQSNNVFTQFAARRNQRQKRKWARRTNSY